MPHVASVASPFAAGNEAQVSKDGRIAFATVTLDDDVVGVPIDATKDIVNKVQSFSKDGLQVEIGGQAIEQERQTESGRAAPPSASSPRARRLVGGLRIVPGRDPAAADRRRSRSASASRSSACCRTCCTMASFSSQLSLLIGLGVGVDYALFIVTRYRQGLHARRSRPRTRSVDALDTSGPRGPVRRHHGLHRAARACSRSGVSFLYGVAIAAVDRRRLHRARRADAAPRAARLLRHAGAARQAAPRGRRRRACATTDESPAWARWAASLQRRPGAARRSAPRRHAAARRARSSRCGSARPTTATTRRHSTTRKAYDLLAKGFGPGFNGPLQLVAEVGTTAGQGGLRRGVVDRRAQPTDGVAAVDASR